MKSRIVEIVEIKKTPEERQAEEMLNQLAPGKAVEVTLSDNEAPKKIIRIYRYSAKRLQKRVRIETLDRGAKLLIFLKGDKDESDD